MFFDVCVPYSHRVMGLSGIGWHADKHVNADINLLQTAFPEGAAGGSWFSPGAFQYDVMMVLYDPERGARPEPNRTSPMTCVA